MLMVLQEGRNYSELYVKYFLGHNVYFNWLVVLQLNAHCSVQCLRSKPVDVRNEGRRHSAFKCNVSEIFKNHKKKHVQIFSMHNSWKEKISIALDFCLFAISSLCALFCVKTHLKCNQEYDLKMQSRVLFMI